MNYLVNSNFIKISAVFVLLSAMMMMMIKKLRKLFTQNKIKAIIYAIVVIISFGLVGLLSSKYLLNYSVMANFVAMQFSFLCLGILHLWILRKYFPSLSENESDFFSEFFFSLIIIFIGLIGFFYVVDIFKPGLTYFYATAAIFYMVPTMVFKMFEFAMGIPVAIYKTWQYPIDEHVADPTQEELTKPVIISFEFRKKVNDLEITNFRVKAPKGMKFGKLFYFFIVDYNERHPESEIEFLDSKSQSPCEWVFHLKPNFFGSIKHLDFDKTVANNAIKENAVVICKRVEETKG